MLTTIIVALVVAVFAGTLWLVMAYNGTVNAAHDIATMKAKLGTIGAENTLLSNKLIGMLGSDELSNFTSNGTFVQEKNPKYFPITSRQSWPLASQ